MNNNFKFKVRGVDNLMGIEELIKREGIVKDRYIKVIDTQAKKTWMTDYPTVKKKFG